MEEGDSFLELVLVLLQQSWSHQRHAVYTTRKGRTASRKPDNPKLRKGPQRGPSAKWPNPLPEISHANVARACDLYRRFSCGTHPLQSGVFPPTWPGGHFLQWLRCRQHWSLVRLLKHICDGHGEFRRKAGRNIESGGILHGVP